MALVGYRTRQTTTYFTTPDEAGQESGCYWCKFIWLGGNAVIWGKWQGTADRSLIFEVRDNTGIIDFNVLGSGGTGSASASTTRVKSNSVVCAGALLGNGGASQVYVNKAFGASVATTGALTNSSLPLGVGGGNPGSASEVILLEWAQWSANLTLAEYIALEHGLSPLDVRRSQLRFYVNPSKGMGAGGLSDLTGAGRNFATVAAGLPPTPERYQEPLFFFPALTIPGLLPPSNSVAPVVSGTPEVGQLLSCTTGTWLGTSLVYTYQWQYNDGTWHDIAGATSSTWTIDVSGAVDVGHTIRCVVTATNLAGAASANSNATSAITGISFTNQYLGVSVS